jgi:phage-related baseplate assembly protein
MSAFTGIDLSQLPAPSIVEVLDFETILQQMKDQLNVLQPLLFADTSSTPTIKEAELVTGENGEQYWRVPYDPDVSGLLYLDLESEPAVKQLEVAAFRELLIRQRFNEAALGVMLAYAQGSDLEQVGAFWGVARLVLDPGQPEADPPVAPTYESDTDYRARIQLAPEGLSTAGPEGSYIFHSLSADADVKDAAAASPSAGNVTVTVLSRTGDGTAPQGTLDAVEAALNTDSIRPLTDNVTVESATIVNYTVDADLTIAPGPDSALVIDAAEAAVTEYVDKRHKLGVKVAVSGLLAALHVEGVEFVTLTLPASDIDTLADEAAYATLITVSEA